MKSLLCLLFCAVSGVAMAVDPIVSGELNPMLPNGNFANDRFPMMTVDSKKVTFEPCQDKLPEATLLRHRYDYSTNDVWFVKTTFLQNWKDLSETNCIVAILVLGNDDIWHIIYKKTTEIKISNSNPKQLSVKVQKGTKPLRMEVWGKRWLNQKWKEVENYSIFKCCVLINGKMATKFAYSKGAKKMFKTMANNIMDDNLMKDEFNIE